MDDLVAHNLGVDGPAKCDDNSRLDWVATDCPFTKLRSEYHFDNCRMEETFASLRFRYAALLSALAPDAPDLPEARRRFGQILHTMQDFYAHSNWVDAHETGLIAERGFCRLVRLALLSYGAPGCALLLDGWVSDRGAYEAACPGDRSLVAAVIMAAL